MVYINSPGDCSNLGQGARRPSLKGEETKNVHSCNQEEDERSNSQLLAIHNSQNR